MTRPPSDGGRAPAGADLPPLARINAVSRTGAGNTVVVGLALLNPSGGSRMLTVTVLGLDPSWLPAPVRLGPVPAGGSALVELALRPPSGTLPARYPFVVAVQSVDPAGRSGSAPTTMVEAALVVDEPSRLSMEVTPADSTAVFGRRLEVLLRNTGESLAEVELRSEVSDGARLRLSRHRLHVPPGGVTRVRGRVALSRPRLIGGRSRHPFSVAARGLGAPTSVTGALTSKPMLSPLGMKLLAFVTVLGLWAGLAAVAIPKLASSVRGKQASPVAAASKAPSTGGSTAPGGAKSGGLVGRAKSADRRRAVRRRPAVAPRPGPLLRPRRPRLSRLPASG